MSEEEPVYKERDRGVELVPQLEQLLFSKPVAFLTFFVSWVFADAERQTKEASCCQNWKTGAERERQPAAIFKTSRLGFENYATPPDILQESLRYSIESQE